MSDLTIYYLDFDKGVLLHTFRVAGFRVEQTKAIESYDHEIHPPWENPSRPRKRFCQQPQFQAFSKEKALKKAQLWCERRNNRKDPEGRIAYYQLTNNR